MPRKNRREVYEELKEIKPGIKVLFLSGYTADILQQKGMLDSGVDLVMKPISPTALLKKVREVLDK